MCKVLWQKKFKIQFYYSIASSLLNLAPLVIKEFAFRQPRLPRQAQHCISCVTIEIVVYTYRDQTCTARAFHALDHLTWV